MDFLDGVRRVVERKAVDPHSMVYPTLAVFSAATDWGEERTPPRQEIQLLIEYYHGRTGSAEQLHTAGVLSPEGANVRDALAVLVMLKPPPSDQDIRVHLHATKQAFSLFIETFRVFLVAKGIQ